MKALISGIHHVTALAGDAQHTVDFYAGILGLRLVKKTVNFDAPSVYHLYFGDETGLPGTILTFFPYGEIGKGRRGNGMVDTVSFSVGAESLSYWEERLRRHGVSADRAEGPFGNDVVVRFRDFDDLALELIFNADDARPGFSTGVIPLEHSIKGFFGVEVWQEKAEPTISVLVDHLDHRLVAEQGNRLRFAASNSPGNYVDILVRPDQRHGLGGNGTVHHVAFSTEDAATQLAVRDKLATTYNPTPVIDRTYFTSVYFREPGGVLFEVATAGPGFTVDEPKEDLGRSLKLPQRYEGHRSGLEASLKPIRVNASVYT